MLTRKIIENIDCFDSFEPVIFFHFGQPSHKIVVNRSESLAELYHTLQCACSISWQVSCESFILVMGDTKNIGSITITITFWTKYRWYRLLKRLLIAEQWRAGKGGAEDHGPPSEDF